MDGQSRNRLIRRWDRATGLRKPSRPLASQHSLPWPSESWNYRFCLGKMVYLSAPFVVQLSIYAIGGARPTKDAFLLVGWGGKNKFKISQINVILAFDFRARFFIRTSKIYIRENFNFSKSYPCGIPNPFFLRRIWNSNKWHREWNSKGILGGWNLKF